MTSDPSDRLRRHSEQPLFHALSGVAYLVDPSGHIVAVGEAGWQAAVIESGPGGAAAPPLDRVIGRPLDDFLTGELVREHYRRLNAAILTGRLPRVRLLQRCDTPDQRRDLLLAISPVREGGEALGLLYQALSLRAEPRPPLRFMDPTARPPAAEPASLPLVMLCSYCKAVRWPPGSGDADGVWISPEEYYRLGGPEAVRLSHGVCPPCFARMLELLPSG